MVSPSRLDPAAAVRDGMPQGTAAACLLHPPLDSDGGAGTDGKLLELRRTLATETAGAKHRSHTLRLCLATHVSTGIAVKCPPRGEPSPRRGDHPILAKKRIWLHRYLIRSNPIPVYPRV
jgi:hypothetical protein